jgi:hypothetical protein
MLIRLDSLLRVSGASGGGSFTTAAYCIPRMAHRLLGGMWMLGLLGAGAQRATASNERVPPVEVARLGAAGHERVDAVDPDLCREGGPCLAAGCRRLLPHKTPATHQACMIKLLTPKSTLNRSASSGQIDAQGDAARELVTNMAHQGIGECCCRAVVRVCHWYSAHRRPLKAAVMGSASIACRLALNSASSVSGGGHLLGLSSSVSSKVCRSM